MNIDQPAISIFFDEMSAASDVMIVEGVGGIMVPLDSKITVLDMAEWLGLPTIIVARPGLGTINHTLLTIAALKSRSGPNRLGAGDRPDIRAKRRVLRRRPIRVRSRSGGRSRYSVWCRNLRARRSRICQRKWWQQYA